MLRAVARGLRSGIARYGSAVFAGREGRWFAVHRPWLEAFAATNGVSWQAARSRAWLFRLMKQCVLIVCAAWLPCFAIHRATHPRVWVLNLLSHPIDLRVDGRLLLQGLAPSSGESPEAGARLRLPVGAHRWVVSAAGQVAFRAQASLTAGAAHLYAPGDHNYCFWIEEQAYGGKTHGRPTLVQPVELSRGLATLAAPVDLWFAPLPPLGTSPVPASGGKLTALRMALCDVRGKTSSGR